MNPVDKIPFLDLHALYLEDREAYDAAYHRVMASGRWILGDEGEAFEQAFAASCERRHAIGVGNGLDALTLALRAAGIGPGDEVLVPAHTFIATWLAVEQVGARPCPVEPAPGRFLIDTAGIAGALTSRTRAVLPVHLYGQATDIAATEALCAERGLVLIEDAAQAQGARQAGRAVGSFGLASCFSFYPGKNLGAFGDAGAITTDDDAVAHRLRQLRNYGASQRYQHEQAGVNSRLDELQAAWLRVRLARLAEHNQRRRTLARIYLGELAGLASKGQLQLPDASALDDAVWHLFVVRSPRRDALQRWLADAGCDSLIHYPKPVYRFPPFAAMAPQGRSAADRLCDEVLSLPMGPHLQAAQVQAVCRRVHAFFDQGSTP